MRPGTSLDDQNSFFRISDYFVDERLRQIYAIFVHKECIGPVCGLGKVRPAVSHRRNQIRTGVWRAQISINHPHRTVLLTHAQRVVPGCREHGEEPAQIKPDGKEIKQIAAAIDNLIGMVGFTRLAAGFPWQIAIATGDIAIIGIIIDPPSEEAVCRGLLPIPPINHAIPVVVGHEARIDRCELERGAADGAGGDAHAGKGVLKRGGAGGYGFNVNAVG